MKVGMRRAGEEVQEAEKTEQVEGRGFDFRLSTCNLSSRGFPQNFSRSPAAYRL
jgi:hypothetical protein